MSLALVFAAVLVIAGGLLHRRRLAELKGDATVDDDVIRQIESRGRVDLDAPLDLDTIHDEEDRFWQEHWDEPESW